MNTTDISSSNNCNNTWSPIVTNVMIALSIIISLGKQFLNNNKHASLKNILIQGRKTEKIQQEDLQTEGIELNVPENLKSSIQKE